MFNLINLMPHYGFLNNRFFFMRFKLFGVFGILISLVFNRVKLKTESHRKAYKICLM